MRGWFHRSWQGRRTTAVETWIAGNGPTDYGSHFKTYVSYICVFPLKFLHFYLVCYASRQRFGQQIITSTDVAINKHNILLTYYSQIINNKTTKWYNVKYNIVMKCVKYKRLSISDIYVAIIRYCASITFYSVLCILKVFLFCSYYNYYSICFYLAF